MAKIVVEEQKDLTVLPPNSILHLKVDELTVREVDGRHGKWEKLEFKFKILGIQVVGDGSPVENYEDVIASPIWGSVPFRLTDSVENRLRQWAEAILGIELGVGYELDTDLFLNRECRGITSQFEKRTKNPATGQPLMGQQIDALLPRGTMPTPAQQPAQDPWANQPQSSPQSSPAQSSPPSQPQPQPSAQPQQTWPPQQQAWEDPPF